MTVYMGEKSVSGWTLSTTLFYILSALCLNATQLMPKRPHDVRDECYLVRSLLESIKCSGSE